MSNPTDPWAFLRREPGFDHYSVHGTSVAVDGKGLLILGSSGSGKSSLAAQMIALGAQLVSDDLTVVAQNGDSLICKRPEHGPEAIELRGLGIVRTRCLMEAPLRYCLLLQADPPARLPEPEYLQIFGAPVLLSRAVYAADLGAKAMVLMAATDVSIGQKPVNPLPHGAP